MADQESYWWEIIGASENYDSAAYVLYEAGSSGAEFKDDEIRCFFYGNDPECQKFVERISTNGFDTLHVGRLRRNDWEADAVRDWYPVKAGEFTITPFVEPEGEMPLKKEHPSELFILPQSGFGIGHHETTQGCLELLSTLKKERIKHVLDIGTGSGILAMAAAQLFNATVEGVDIDEAAIRCAEKNAFYNGLGDTVQFSTKRIESFSKVYDLILANIYAEYHDSHKDDYQRLLRPKGFLLLSGIDADKYDGTKERYLSAYTLLGELKAGRWATMLWMRS